MEGDGDLIKKTTDELILIKKELSKEKMNVNNEIKKHNREIENYQSILKRINVKIALVEKKLQDYKLNEEIKIFLNSKSNIEGIELLNENELLIITDKMDKKDYGQYGNYPRFHDFGRICESVIKMKNKYPNWVLKAMSLQGQEDSLPPRIFYNYMYEDENGECFRC